MRSLGAWLRGQAIPDMSFSPDDEWAFSTEMDAPSRIEISLPPSAVWMLAASLAAWLRFNKGALDLRLADGSRCEVDTQHVANPELVVGRFLDSASRL